MNFLSRIKRGLLITSLLTLAAAPLLMPLSGSAQPANLTGLQPYTPNYLTTPTNLTVTAAGFGFTNQEAFVLTNGQNLVITSGGSDVIRQNNGESIFASVTATNPLAIGSLFLFDVNGDGTNSTTTHPVQLYVPTPGVGTFIGWTNYSAAQLNNVRQLKFTSASNSIAGTVGAAGNGTNTVTVNWLQFSRSVAQSSY